MGTRADFYVGTLAGEKEWLGSIAWDGYPVGNPEHILEVRDEKEYRYQVDVLLRTPRTGGTHPSQGWPWSWRDSRLTEYAYVFDPVQQAVFFCHFGHGWARKGRHDTDFLSPQLLALPKLPHGTFPDMQRAMNVVPAGDMRSGILLP